MFSALGAWRQRLKDMSTLKALCVEAERLANAEGQTEPGAEHFVMSALALPDGTARKAFVRIHADPDRYRAAIAAQYQSALKHVGLDLPPDAMTAGDESPVAPGDIYHAQPSAQALMKVLVEEVRATQPQSRAAAPLLGAHVLLAATKAGSGVAVRALRAMDIDPHALAQSAQAEIAAHDRA